MVIFGASATLVALGSGIWAPTMLARGREIPAWITAVQLREWFTRR